LIGADSSGHQLKNLLEQAGVDCRFTEVHSHPTIVKQRVLSQHHQLIRLDIEENFSPEASSRLSQNIVTYLSEFDLVILSDYGKGTLHACSEIIKAARELNCPVFVDPKGLDFSKYRGAYLLTPNRKEFEAVAGRFDTESDIANKAFSLIDTLELQSLLITRGDQGMSLIQSSLPAFHVGTQAQEVFDVTGAGDTVIATLAASFAAGASLQDATVLANYAAGLVVAKLGAASVSPSELRRAMHVSSGSYLGTISEEQLKIYVDDAKAHGEKIVFTNGCFDILHVGHIQYLQQARLLGDRLIIAVNDDASVKRLKGEERPINSLSNRMLLLAALDRVDWVVPFSEDTPLRLIEAIRPDVLVKGGDYTIDQIVGSKEVLSWGGKVCVLPFHEGHSTTRLIQSLKEVNV
jgi:D-beta-D-heptose 7-phosphate kinase / D-beta-D-heptose 1-phosphate adenosyltransferase